MQKYNKNSKPSLLSEGFLLYTMRICPFGAIVKTGQAETFENAYPLLADNGIKITQKIF
jgi:hypothetical protein